MSETTLVPCKYCDATGQAYGASCGGCNGVGHVTVQTDRDGAPKPCASCGGTGAFKRAGTFRRTICPACDGAGWAGVMHGPFP